MNKVSPISQQNRLPPLKHKNVLVTQQEFVQQKVEEGQIKAETTMKQKLENSNMNLNPQMTEQRQTEHKILQDKQPSKSITPLQIVIIVVVGIIILALIAIIVATLYLIPIQRSIVIMGTNDLHGKVYPTPLFRSDNRESYNYGGLATLITLMKTISQQNQNNLLYLDSGDQYQGGIQSSKLVSSGQIMNDFFKKANLKASTIGNHQFDDGPDFLFNFLRGRQTPNLIANLKSETGSSDFLPNQKSSEIFQFPNGIKVGFIGLVTTQTPTTTSTFINKKFPPYQFQDYSDIVLNKSIELKAKGADAIILVTHVGNSCANDFTYGIWNIQNSPNICPNDQISSLIDKLPEGTINAVVQGHRHRIAHYYYKGIPFMGTISGGFYTNFMYLKFNRDKKIIDSSIEGPVPICEKVFQNTQRCDYVQSADISAAGKLMSWKFHGTDVVPDQEFNGIINSKWGQKMTLYRQFIVNNEISLAAVKTRQYELGNLFTNLLHEVVPTADFTILNTGGFRTQWFPGVINYEQYFNMFPFTNYIVTFTMTGAELLSSLNILQSGVEFFPAWNLQSSVQINNSTSVRTVLSSKLANGTEIDSNSTYKGVTIKFLIDGGDRFSLVKNVTYNTTNLQTIGQYRDTIKPYLKALGTIRAGTLIDPSQPRIILSYV